jgi:hypothetical protein
MCLALHRKMFEEQMHTLEQQQAQELLDLPVDNNRNDLQHMAASAPTTPRVNALLLGGTEISPTLHTRFAQMRLDTDFLMRTIGSIVDKCKFMTYAPAARSPSLHAQPGITQ